MARKKITRTAKGTKMAAKKKTTTKAVVPLTERMEKDFRSAPAKIAAEYRKEVVVLKQQEGKLKVELKKAQVVQKALKVKQTALASKKTAAAKKQLATIKKTQDALMKAVKEHSKKMEQIQKSCKTQAAKQVKFSAINKQLGKLERELSQKSSAVKAKPAKKTRKVSAKKEKPAVLSRNETLSDAQPVTHRAIEETELTS